MKAYVLNLLVTQMLPLCRAVQLVQAMIGQKLAFVEQSDGYAWAATSAASPDELQPTGSLMGSVGGYFVWRAQRNIFSCAAQRDTDGG